MQFASASQASTATESGATQSDDSHSGNAGLNRAGISSSRALRLVGGLGMTCLLAATLAACGTARHAANTAPPPMKPLDPSASPVYKAPAPAQAVAPAAQTAPAPAPAPAVSAAPAQPAGLLANAPAPGLIVVKAGLHRCELARRVLVKRVTTEGDAVQINWAGKDYELRSVTTQSGARRFENTKAGLAWVVISVKAFLLDTRHGQMLANECNL